MNICVYVSRVCVHKVGYHHDNNNRCMTNRFSNIKIHFVFFVFQCSSIGSSHSTPIHSIVFYTDMSLLRNLLILIFMSLLVSPCLSLSLLVSF